MSLFLGCVLSERWDFSDICRQNPAVCLCRESLFYGRNSDSQRRQGFRMSKKIGRPIKNQAAFGVRYVCIARHFLRVGYAVNSALFLESVLDFFVAFRQVF